MRRSGKRKLLLVGGGAGGHGVHKKFIPRIEEGKKGKLIFHNIPWGSIARKIEEEIKEEKKYEIKIYNRAAEELNNLKEGEEINVGGFWFKKVEGIPRFTGHSE